MAGLMKVLPAPEILVVLVVLQAVRVRSAVAAARIAFVLTVTFEVSWFRSSDVASVRFVDFNCGRASVQIEE
jgi:hypothetical protein